MFFSLFRVNSLRGQDLDSESDEIKGLREKVKARADGMETIRNKLDEMQAQINGRELQLLRCVDMDVLLLYFKHNQVQGLNWF